MAALNPTSERVKLSESSATVTTAGTRVQLTSTTGTYYQIKIINPTTNTGIVYVGGASVSSTVYSAALFPGDSVDFLAIIHGLEQATYDPTQIYIDSNVSATSVIVSYVERSTT